MATLTVADRRVTELQEALRVALAAKAQVTTLARNLALVEQALDQACEAIYNATLYDPAGERTDEEGDDA